MLIILTVAVLIGWSYCSRNLEAFNIKEIEVRDNVVSNKNDIIAKSGIFTGDNIMSFSKRKAKKGIKEIPIIKDVRISRRYPSKVVIDVEEEESYFIMEMDGAYYEIEKNGKVIAKDSSITRFDEPLITGIEIEKLKVKDNVFEKSESRLETVKNVLDYLDEEKIIDRLSEYYISKDGKSSLYFENGSVVSFRKYEAFSEHKDFVVYFIKEINKKQKLELVEGVDPTYSKL